jgi:hypothetical protein
MKNKLIFDQKLKKEIRKILDSASRVVFLLSLSLLFIFLISDIFLASGGIDGLRYALGRNQNIQKLIQWLPFSEYIKLLPDHARILIEYFKGNFLIAGAIGCALMAYQNFLIIRFIYRFFCWAFRRVVPVFIFCSSVFFFYAAFFSRENMGAVMVYIFWVGLGLGVCLIALRNGVLARKIIDSVFRNIIIIRSWLGIFWDKACAWLNVVQKRLGLFLGEYDSKSIFLNDRALGENGEDPEDELGLTEDAERFARDVLNNGSSDPMVFGLDAPWGSGKSSYLSLCRNLVWDKERNVVVVHFKPILYDFKRQDLFGVFSGEVLASLRYAGVPAFFLARHLRALGKIIDGASVGFWGGLVSSFFGLFSVSSSSLIESIRSDIRRSGKKLIVIVDDLDRLYIEDVKEMLGIVRNVFHVENMTFVLCYDSESVNSFEFQKKTVHTESYLKESKDIPSYSRESHDPDNQAINAYFEKIVQVKKTLILNREQLKEYCKKQIGEMGIAFREGIDDIFSSEKFPSYHSMVGDIRKIKRVVNFLRVAGLLGVDYQNRDIAPKYILKFVLLYVNFPHIFRKIYIEETGGACGFFSVIHDGASGNGDINFKNSELLKDFLASVGRTERFILKELFEIQNGLGTFGKSKQKEILESKDFQRTSPMFNGGMFLRKNLEDYLRLILERRLLPLEAYENFHISMVRQLDTEEPGHIFSKTQQYSAENGESPRDQFFAQARHVVGFSRARKIIDYILGDLHQYSLVNDFSGIYNGLRDDLVYEIIFLLNRNGWDGDSYENTDENVRVIANRILGEEEYVNRGIFDALLDSTRGVLGLEDALRFLSGCRGSGGDSTYNVRRAFDLYGKDRAIREISQRFFSEFEKRYINVNENLIEEIEGLSQESLLGDFEDFIRKEFEGKGQNIADEIAKIRSSLTGHIIGQLSSQKSDALGQYDEKGLGDANGISQNMRKYIFGTCFDVVANAKNSQRFVDYMLASLSHNYATKGYEFIPKLKDYQSWLGESELRDYWKKNHEKIKSHCRGLSGNTQVFTYNYVAKYQDDLEDLFRELDKMLAPQAELKSE